MAVRKRTWTTAKGEQREAWIVDYRDRQGDRHIETFDRKKDADAKHAEVSSTFALACMSLPARARPSPRLARYGLRLRS